MCKCKDIQQDQEWPDDAPEWANSLATVYTDNANGVGTGRMQVVSSIERPKPAVKKIDWTKLASVVSIQWEAFTTKSARQRIPSPWIAWNCDEHTRGNPLPDGLKIEWYGTSNCNMASPPNMPPPWSVITRFRIVGIQEGWE